MEMEEVTKKKGDKEKRKEIESKKERKEIDEK